MADFSLGAAGGRNRQRQVAEEVNEGIPPESLFLYSGGGSARGFELWQRHQQQIHQRHQQQQLYSASSGALLAFGSADEPIGPGPTRTGTRGGGGGMSCQDCGNQAKKDCAHMRCRTCCKSRGFQCPTHVRSTWVPAAKRRERQHQLVALQQAHPSPTCHRASAGEAPKRPRELSIRPPTIVTTTTSGGTEGMLSFPAELSSPAVFRCVRVSPVEEVENQFAYQTAVTIGGHVFKGILYDQGPESSTAQYQLHHRGDSSSTAAAVAGIESTATTTTTVMGTTAGSLPDPSSLYPTPLSAFMAGTQFFPHHPRQ
ncbi:hypothetical protein IEQ34_027003 [Dendrobium chrysotoxum]|uniref:Uncharacterized protein n=1 Tax=Dendrobium chrysotoxum TaxID=161865 RepID=A0AAV7FIB4_DENCH|nr:hypothetical protein IEQ34_027003 [Dendrobium chrysotoxum]